MNELCKQVNLDIRAPVLDVLGYPYGCIHSDIRGGIFMNFHRWVIDNRMQIDVDINLHFGHDVFDLTKLHD